jgi:NADH dehydrogenase (ubiquinone) Fe-S protein 3
MLLKRENIVKISPIVRLELYNRESSLLAPTSVLDKILIIVKRHFKYQYEVLTCVSCVDYPESMHRFQIVYELLSLMFNSRLRIKGLADELVPVNSAEKIYSGASW